MRILREVIHRLLGTLRRGRRDDELARDLTMPGNHLLLSNMNVGQTHLGRQQESEP